MLYGLGVLSVLCPLNLQPWAPGGWDTKFEPRVTTAFISNILILFVHFIQNNRLFLHQTNKHQTNNKVVQK